MSLESLELETGEQSETISTQEVADTTAELSNLDIQIAQISEAQDPETAEALRNDPALRAEILDFLQQAANNQLGEHLGEFNAAHFDSNGQAGLDRFEFNQFADSLDAAIDQIIILDGQERFTEIHTDSGEVSWYEVDQHAAAFADDLIPTDEIVDLLRGENASVGERVLNGAGLSDAEIQAMRDQPFSIYSTDSLGQTALLLALELGEGAEDMVRMISNIPSATALVPRYLGFRAQALSSDPQEATEAQIHLEDLSAQNPALAMLNLLGEQGVALIQQIGGMLTSGTQGDVAAIVSTIPGMMAGGAGLARLGARGTQLATREGSRANRIAGAVERGAGRIAERADAVDNTLMTLGANRAVGAIGRMTPQPTNVVDEIPVAANTNRPPAIRAQTEADFVAAGGAMGRMTPQPTNVVDEIPVAANTNRPPTIRAQTEADFVAAGGDWNHYSAVLEGGTLVFNQAKIDADYPPGSEGRTAFLRELVSHERAHRALSVLDHATITRLSSAFAEQGWLTDPDFLRQYDINLNADQVSNFDRVNEITSALIGRMRSRQDVPDEFVSLLNSAGISPQDLGVRVGRQVGAPNGELGLARAAMTDSKAIRAPGIRGLDDETVSSVLTNFGNGSLDWNAAISDNSPLSLRNIMRQGGNGSSVEITLNQNLINALQKVADEGQTREVSTTVLNEGIQTARELLSEGDTTIPMRVFGLDVVNVMDGIQAHRALVPEINPLADLPANSVVSNGTHTYILRGAEGESYRLDDGRLVPQDYLANNGFEVLDADAAAAVRAQDAADLAARAPRVSDYQPPENLSRGDYITFTTGNGRVHHRQITEVGSEGILVLDGGAQRIHPRVFERYKVTQTEPAIADSLRPIRSAEQASQISARVEEIFSTGEPGQTVNLNYGRLLTIETIDHDSGTIQLQDIGVVDRQDLIRQGAQLPPFLESLDELEAGSLLVLTRRERNLVVRVTSIENGRPIVEGLPEPEGRLPLTFRTLHSEDARILHHGGRYDPAVGSQALLRDPG